MSMIKTYEGNDKYIFASYRHADAERVYPILAEFEKLGLRFWYDAGIYTGDEWDVEIDKHIEHSHAVIVFASKAYFQSQNCREELKFARNLNKRLLLVYLEDAEPPRGLRMRLSGIQAIYYHQYKEKVDFYSKFFKTPEIQVCTGEAYVTAEDDARDNPSESWMNKGIPGKHETDTFAGNQEKESDDANEPKMQTVPKKAWKAKLTRQKKRLEAEWNALPGGKYIRTVLNVFFAVEILMLIMANAVVLEGYLQYRYFHFRLAGGKIVLSADMIRFGVGAVAAVFTLLGILVFRKWMKSFWKYIVWTIVSAVLFINMGTWQNMRPEIVRMYASPMEDMHIYMEMSDTQRGTFFTELKKDVLSIPRDINLTEIRQIEKEHGLSWEEWEITVAVETSAAPCEFMIYKGKHVDNGDRIEVQIPLSKLQCDYGLLMVHLENAENQGANIIFGARPYAWYQKLFYKPDRLYEASEYERMFSKGSWKYIVMEDAAEISALENIAWTMFISSPEVSLIGIILLGMAVVCSIYYRVNIYVFAKAFDAVEAGAGKKIYLWIASWGIGSFAVLMFILCRAIEILVEWIFKLL